MNKMIYAITLFFMSALLACNENDDHMIYNGPNYVSFIKPSESVLVIENAENVFPVQIGVTNADVSKTYSIEIDTEKSTAVEGVHFSIDTREITIEAGKYVSEFHVTSIFEELPDEGLVVVFKLVNASDVAAYSILEHSLELVKFCPCDKSSISGIYDGSSDVHGGIPVTIQASPGLNEVRVSELASVVQWSWGENWIKGDGSCSMVFYCGNVVKIPRQWIGDSNYPDAYGIEGIGSYDPLSGDITITYQVYYNFGPTTGEGVFDVPETTTLTKQQLKYAMD